MLCTREASAGPCLLLGTLSLQSKLRSGQPLGALERDEREERRERKRELMLLVLRWGTFLNRVVFACKNEMHT